MKFPFIGEYIGRTSRTACPPFSSSLLFVPLGAALLRLVGPERDINALADIVQFGNLGTGAFQLVVLFLPPRGKGGVLLLPFGNRQGLCAFGQLGVEIAARRGWISGYQNKEEELTALAEHIVSTRQLFCSSCQVIYLDTESMCDIEEFCHEFLPYLDAATKNDPITEIGAVAEITLRRYNDVLEHTIYGNKGTDRRVFQGEKCSLTACMDSMLELSYMYGNCLVKRLPRKCIMSCLRNGKGYLQTAGLIADAASREELTENIPCGGIQELSTLRIYRCRSFGKGMIFACSYYNSF